MYQIDVSGIQGAQSGRRSWLFPAVSRTVWLLGLTSLFTDISSEMVSSVLPAYLVLYLRLSPLQFGFVDGLYQGVTALVRVAGGWIADRGSRHKTVAAMGYGLSAVCKLGLLAAGTSWPWIAGVIAIDRSGKGIRTAPRDAMISLSTSEAELGTAFGAHRAMDAAGAMLGPVVAFVLLAVVQDGFDVVFVTSFFVACIGLGVLTLLVQPSSASDTPAPGDTTRIERVAQGHVFRLLQDSRFRAVTMVGALLSLATMSDAFVFLVLQNRLALGAEFLPLMYVGVSLFFLLLAFPAGRLADRLGRARMFLCGHLLLAIAYGLLIMTSTGVTFMLLTLLLMGAYYAATDGVLVALASPMIPVASRATGLAIVTTMTSACRMLASVGFGALWAWWGMDSAVVAFGVSLLAGTAAGIYLLPGAVNLEGH